MPTTYSPTTEIPTTDIPTTVLGLSSPLPYRPAGEPAPAEVVLGPSSAVAAGSWAEVVHRQAQRPARRSSCTPAYYLGRSAEVWLTALGSPVTAVGATTWSTADRHAA